MTQTLLPKQFQRIVGTIFSQDASQCEKRSNFPQNFTRQPRVDQKVWFRFWLRSRL